MSLPVWEPKEKPAIFVWTPATMAHFMESFFSDDGKVLLRPRNGGFLEPLKVFLCYFLFCKRAFNGCPPKECTIEVYEKMIDEMLPANFLEMDEDVNSFAPILTEYDGQAEVNEVK